MTLLEKENAIRKLLGCGKPDYIAEEGLSGLIVVMIHQGNRMPFRVEPYYGGVNSIGIVLRDVVPRLWSGKFQPMLLQRDDKSWGVYAWDKWEGDHDLLCSSPDLAAMPAACCDALLRKEGLLT